MTSVPPNLPTEPLPPPPRGPKLALWVRLLLLAVGWLLVLVGIAGLALPGIQGILTILVGAAVLSIASESVYRLLRRLMMRRWPGAWTRVDGFRTRMHARLARRPESGDTPPRR